MRYNAVCGVINRIIDDNGDETLGDEFTTDCYEEQLDLVEIGKAGANTGALKFDRFYMLPPGVVIKEEDFIHTTIRQGVSVIESNKIVKQVNKIGGYTTHHIEVYV